MLMRDNLEMMVSALVDMVVVSVAEDPGMRVSKQHLVFVRTFKSLCFGLLLSVSAPPL